MSTNVRKAESFLAKGFVFAILLSMCVSAIGAGFPFGGQKAEKVAADKFMGDWQGSWQSAGGESGKLAAQVICWGNGEYQANFLKEFDTAEKPLGIVKGKLEGGRIDFTNAEIPDSVKNWQAYIEKGKFSGTFMLDQEYSFELEQVTRLSPTFGAVPPEGAIVLFDGSDIDSWMSTGKFSGLVDLAKVVGGENSAAYLRSYVYSENGQKAVLELGSDDGVKAWFNGKVVHENNAARGVVPGNDKVNVSLEKGWNLLMLKITQGGGGWACCARLVGENGEPLQNISEADAYSILAFAGKKPTRKYLEGSKDYLTVWEVSGPYNKEGADSSALFDMVFAPEEGKGKWHLIRRNYFAKEGVEWKIKDDILECEPHSGSILTTQKFQSFKMHIEFKTPFMPDAKGQGRGNSGIYLQNRYELQVLDSYGLEGLDNECGGVYQIARPALNMCAPPGQWQTYDITFTAPVCDGTGNKIENARLKVVHNGVMIHENLELPHPTGGGMNDNPCTPGGIQLQDHNNTVQYKNIWLVEN